MQDDDSTGKSLVTKTEGAGARLTVKLSVTPRAGEQSLKEKYGVTKYDLGFGYGVPEALKTLIPSDVPEFIDQGEQYVERVMRALYYFKQCALVGPSGTGKSVCAGEPVYAMVDGRLSLTTVEALFEDLSRKLPVQVDADGWQTIVLNKVNIKILSMDGPFETISWKRPYAVARSVYRGDVVRVTTSRNRTIKATPDHSFVSDEGVVNAGKLRVGTSIPIVRWIPRPEVEERAEVNLVDYVEDAHLTDKGVVVGRERVSLQIPSPLSVELDQDFSWFLGFFVAEGYIGKGFASIYNEAEVPIRRCAKLLQSLGISTSRRGQRGLVELRAFSKAFVSFLSKTTLARRVGIGKGSQARYKKVPEFMFSAGDNAKLAFLRGFYDGDGWVEEDSELVMGTSSGELANGLTILCEGLKLFPTIRVKGKVPSYSVILGRDGAEKLGVRMKNPGGRTDNRGHVEKVRISSHMLAVAKVAYARIPAETRSRAFHKRTVSSFYASTGMIGLHTLLRIANELRSEELRRVAESNMLWDSVKEVRRERYDGWVYDFQVPGTETFVAGFGGVVTHNTHIVYLVAKIAGIPLWEINCGLQTSVYDLFGRFVGLGKENWVDGQIVSWCRYGGILYLDEANMMKQDIATRLNPILDTRGHMVLTEKDNEVIPRNQFGYMIISMNPFSSEFAGTKPLNAAFRRRMSVWLDFDYLSVGARISEREVQLTAARANVPTDIAEKIVRTGAEIRKRYKNGDLPYAPSVGDLINWATLVADGLAAVKAADETIVSLTSDDPEVQTSVRRIIQMVFGSSESVKSEG